MDHPILLIHGYSTEGKSNTVEEIYGNLPNALRQHFGSDGVREIDLSRWISVDEQHLNLRCDIHRKQELIISRKTI